MAVGAGEAEEELETLEDELDELEDEVVDVLVGRLLELETTDELLTLLKVTVEAAV